MFVSTDYFLQLPGEDKSPIPIYPPAQHIGCPVCPHGSFSPVILMLCPGPPLGCLPVAIPKLGHLAKQAGRHSLGSHQAELSPELMQDEAPLPLIPLPPPGKTPRLEFGVCQTFKEVMEVFASLLESFSTMQILMWQECSFKSCSYREPCRF